MSCAVFCLRVILRNGCKCSWTQPKHVPICFLSSLTTVCLKEFEGLEDQMKMVVYVLKNARVLRTMEIHAADKLSSDSKLCIFKNYQCCQGVRRLVNSRSIEVLYDLRELIFEYNGHSKIF